MEDDKVFLVLNELLDRFPKPEDIKYPAELHGNKIAQPAYGIGYADACKKIILIIKDIVNEHVK